MKYKIKDITQRLLMKIYILLLASILTLSGCGGITYGETTAIQNVGSNQYMVQGYNTQDAIDAANASCSRVGRRFQMINLIPSTSRTRATLTSTCN